MIIVSASHFHVYLPGGVNVNVHLAECLDSVLNVKALVDSPSRGLLGDYKPSNVPSFEALVTLYLLTG